MNQRWNDIPYTSEAGERNKGDFTMPAGHCRGCVLLIHGGGWITFAKERMTGIAEFLAEHGCASFSINYPFISTHPWPACGDACLAAGRFIQRGGLDQFADLSTKPLFVLGASAGAHLALMTGMRMGGIAGIASIAGISDLQALSELNWFTSIVPDFFGMERPENADWRDASPLSFVQPGLPPLFLSHDHNDEVVPFSQAEELAAKVAASGNEVDFYAYHGPGHLMWVDLEAESLRLLPGIEQRLLTFIERCMVR